MRCDQYNEAHNLSIKVSIHTPTWGVTYVLFLWHTSVWSFQSTHLHEVWPSEASSARFVLSFNPHTYMRCDDIIESIRINLKVSIHTPTWGVTLHLLHTSVMSHVSIHTPTWGVTTFRELKWHMYLFQSTHLHEVWLCYNFYDFRSLVFQSTHLHEVWLWSSISRLYCFKFQSTHLHEVWHSLPSIHPSPSSFNPHTYMRCDIAVSGGTYRDWLVSIHTPTWGVTIIFYILRAYFWSFNPHTYMRCDTYSKKSTTC